MDKKDQIERSKIEREHPIVKGAAKKGATCGLIGFGVFAVAAVFIWSLTPFSNLGFAYSLVQFLPYGLGLGALLVVASLIMKRSERSSKPDASKSKPEA